jgi:plasmid stabilization system protein ParE
MPQSKYPEDLLIVCRPFKIIYRMSDGGDVIIVAVVHGARDLRIGDPPDDRDLDFDDD